MINLGLDMLKWSCLWEIHVAIGDSSLELWKDLWPGAGGLRVMVLR